MASSVNVGVWGLGVHLPSQVRGNDWWPPAVVAGWKARHQARITQGEPTALPPGARRALDAAAELAGDVFEGARERRVMPPGTLPTDMQIDAGREAIAAAGVDPRDVDLLLIQSTTSDYLHVPDGCRVHAALGLSPRCFTAQVDMMCSGFLQQLVLAEAMIRAGTGRLALLVQCSAMSRHLRPEDPWSAWFGDAATAAVVGPVSAGHGVLTHAHVTDGRFHGGLVSGVPGGRWWDGGKPVAYVADHDKARGMMMAIPDTVTRLIEDTLDRAGVAKREVRFVATHQATSWLGRVIQEHAGLDLAGRVDAFPWTASVVGCNLPITLSVAERDRMIGDGDVVVMFAGAAGMTAGALVCRWGR
jgi:3-oxoacyl-[acyl-carrier-protein] synthase III